MPFKALHLHPQFGPLGLRPAYIMSSCNKNIQITRGVPNLHHAIQVHLHAISSRIPDRVKEFEIRRLTGHSPDLRLEI